MPTTTEKILMKRMLDNKKPLKAVSLIAFNLHSDTGLGIKMCKDAYILMENVTKHGIYDNTLEYLKEGYNA